MREAEVIEQVKKKRTRPDRTEALSVHTEPGEMSEMIRNAMVLSNLPEIDTNDAEQMSQRVGEYFEICEARDMKPSVSGLALAIGTDRRRLWEWVNVPGAKPRAVTDTIKKAYQILNFAIEEYMQNGKINPVSGIFLMKNNFGYQDKSEVVLTPNNPLGETIDKRTLEEKYLDALPSGDAEGAEVDISEAQKAAEGEFSQKD